MRPLRFNAGIQIVGFIGGFFAFAFLSDPKVRAFGMFGAVLAAWAVLHTLEVIVSNLKK